MKYELKVVDDNCIKIKKVMEVPLWNSNQVFDDLESLVVYIVDYTEVRFSMNELRDLLNAAAMNCWVEFQ